MGTNEDTGIGQEPEVFDEATGPHWVPLPGLRHFPAVREVVKAEDGARALLRNATTLVEFVALVGSNLSRPIPEGRSAALAKELPPPVMAAVAARIKEAIRPLSRALSLANGNTVTATQTHPTLRNVIERARDRFRKVVKDGYAGLDDDTIDNLARECADATADAMAEFTGGLDWRMPPVIPYTPVLDEAARETVAKSDAEIATDQTVEKILDAHGLTAGAEASA